MSIEAMRQALDALEQIKCFMFHPAKVFTWEPSITALRTAIEQAEKQEPVAWTSLTEIDWARREPGRAGSFWAIPNDPTKEIALYAAPRQWVGLTAEEIWACYKTDKPDPEYYILNALDFAEAIEAKLKGKNDVLRSV